MSDHKPHEKEIDEFTGVETTGHEWDGLKELNNPLPRWWLWVWLICIIWSFGYWYAYPAWPTPDGNTKGALGWTSKKKLAASQAEIFERQSAYLERFRAASFDEIMNDDELYAFAMAGGKSAFKDNCATCHGTGGAGGMGYPNLNDDDWLWGGQIEQIQQTLKYGIRTKHEDTRLGIMPSFGKDGTLNKNQINDVVAYVMTLSGKESAHGHAVQDISKGAEIFSQNCASCHGADGKGMKEFGSANLTDKIWLYGGDRETLFKTIYNGRAGLMPFWNGRLDKQTIRELAVYVHQLGGGEVADEPGTIIDMKGEEPEHDEEKSD
tara:strand:+ start:1091 stop:2056 length:966 start_codon:yes stop_codon:yes gene_type:complete